MSTPSMPIGERQRNVRCDTFLRTRRSAWTKLAPLEKEAWRRRFAPRSTSCAEQADVRSLQRSLVAVTRFMVKRERRLLTHWRTSEHSRVSGQGLTPQGRSADSAWRGSQNGRRSDGAGEAVRRYGGDQGPGSRGPPGKGGRREAGHVAHRSKGGRDEDRRPPHQ